MITKIPASRVARLDVPQAVLGESVRWDDRRGLVFYVDTEGRELRGYDPADGSHRIWPLEQRVGAWFPSLDGRLLMAMETGLFWFSPETAQTELYAPLEPDAPEMRGNDGRCDPQGRLWISTMNMEKEAESDRGRLYRVAPDGSAPEPVMEGLHVANTTAFSPDGRRMYFADTPLRRVWRFDFDGRTGTMSGRRTFFALDDDATGQPDGACMDSDGGLWVAMPKGGRVERRDPDGSLDVVVETPCENPTMCGFGGAGLETLFITSKSEGLSAAERAARPDEGALFAVSPGRTGLPEARFGAAPG